jgi:phage baseplate assembly protein W
MAWGNEVWNQYDWGNESPLRVGPPNNRFTPGQAAQARVLGKDLFFENDYDVTPHGDYVLIDGLRALRQSILHRIITRQGEFKTRPQYGVGLRDFVKKPMNPTNLGLIKRKITEQLAREPRIEEVLAVIVQPEDTTLKVSVAIRAAGKALTLQPFVFDAVGNPIGE